MTDHIPALSSTTGPQTHLGETDLLIPPDITFDQWVDVGRPILRGTASSMWWIGDWLLYAEERWATDDTGEEVTAERARIRRAVAQVCNLDVETLRGARWVARSITPDRRRATVPWSLHLLVAGLDAPIADRLLEQAESEGWSKREMSAAVKAANAVDVDEAPDPPVKPLRVGWRIVVDDAHRAEVEQLVEEHRAQILKQLARRKVAATVEVA